VKQKLNCVLLVDDDDATNFINKMYITKADCTEELHIAKDGQEALDFLKKSVDGSYPHPDLIFLDINMPKVNGWEFLQKYKELDTFQKGDIIIVMLTTSFNPYDQIKAEETEEITGFRHKPMTKNLLDGILHEYFADRF